MASEYDTTWRVPPEVQRQRDEGALALKLDELAADPSNPALQRDVAFTRAQLSGANYGPAVGTSGGTLAPTSPPMPRPPQNFQTTNPQIQGLESQRDVFQTGLNQRLDTLSTGRDVAAGDLQQTLGQPMPGRPNLNQLPTYTPKPYSQEDALGFAAIATAFMSLAGLRARQPLTAAMAAAGQAMNGYTTGRFAQVKQDLDVFRSEFTSGLAANRQMLEEYQSIINDRNTTRAEKMALYQVAATRWNDEATKGMLRLGQYDRAIQSAYTLLNNQQKMEQHGKEFYDGLDARLQIAGMRQKPAEAIAPTDEAGQTALDIQAWNYLSSRVLPYRKGTGGGADRNDAVVRRAAEISQQLKITPEAVSAMPAEWKANAGSMLLQTKKLDAIGAQLESFHNNLDTWNSLAQGITPQIGGEKVRALAPLLERINFTGVQSIDDVKLRIQQQTNDPTVNAYLIASMAAAMDYARIMSGPQSAAQLTEGARNDAERLIRAGADDNARIGIMAALESDTEGQRKGMEKQLEEIRGRMSRRTGSNPVGAGPKSFATEQEAAAAAAAGRISIGDQITVGGKPGRWR